MELIFNSFLLVVTEALVGMTLSANWKNISRLRGIPSSCHTRRSDTDWGFLAIARNQKRSTFSTRMFSFFSQKGIPI